MIGKVIKSLLEDDATLTAIVPTARIYPYVMNEGTALPAIIYTIDSIGPEYTKDGWANDEVMFSVVSFSNNYTELQSIISAVRGALEWEHGTVEGIGIGRIYLEGFMEGYSIGEDTFLNKLSFRVNVINY
jgi:hypothetical protein